MLKARIETLLWVAIFSYLGVLTRAILSTVSALSKGPESAGGSLLAKLGTGFFLQNIVGSFVIGLMTPLHVPMMKHAAIYTGICSGYCGSCTTFATWNLNAIGLLMNGKWLDSVIQSFITVSTSYGAMLCGGKLGECFADLVHKTKTEGDENVNEEAGAAVLTLNNNSQQEELIHGNCTTHLSNTSVNSTIMNPMQSECSDDDDPEACALDNRKLSYTAALACFVCLGSTVALWTLAMLDEHHTRGKWWIAASFGPFGAITRYSLSLRNHKWLSFPLYTFIANVCATTINVLIIIGLHGIEVTSLDTIGSYNFWVRAGLSTGAMGSLSTVSTFVNEIRKLSIKGSRFSLRYCLATIAAAHGIGLLISASFELITGQNLFNG